MTRKRTISRLHNNDKHNDGEQACFRYLDKRTGEKCINETSRQQKEIRRKQTRTLQYIKIKHASTCGKST